MSGRHDPSFSPTPLAFALHTRAPSPRPRRTCPIRCRPAGSCDPRRDDLVPRAAGLSLTVTHCPRAARRTVAAMRSQSLTDSASAFFGRRRRGREIDEAASAYRSRRRHSRPGAAVGAKRQPGRARAAHRVILLSPTTIDRAAGAAGAVDQHGAADDQRLNGLAFVGAAGLRGTEFRRTRRARRAAPARAAARHGHPSPRPPQQRQHADSSHPLPPIAAPGSSGCIEQGASKGGN